MSDEEDPHTVSSLFKLFLRELKDPVFPYDLYETFIQIQTSIGNIPDAWNQTMLNLFATFPKENLLVMKEVFALANEAQKHTAENKMDAKNLSIVLAPNLLRGKDEDCLTSMKNTPIINSIVRNIIENYDEFFGPKFLAILETKN